MAEDVSLTIRLEGLAEAGAAAAGASSGKGVSPTGDPEEGASSTADEVEAARKEQAAKRKVRREIQAEFRKERNKRKAEDKKRAEDPGASLRGVAQQIRSGAGFLGAAVTGDPLATVQQGAGQLQRIIAKRGGALGAGARAAGKAAGAVTAGIDLFRAGTKAIGDLEPIVLAVLKRAGIDTDSLETLKGLGNQARRVESGFESIPKSTALINEISNQAALLGLPPSVIKGIGNNVAAVEFAQANLAAATRAREKHQIAKSKDQDQTLIEQGASQKEIVRIVQMGAMRGRH